MKDVLRSASRSCRAAVLMSTACTALHAPSADENSPRPDANRVRGTPVPWSAGLFADPFFVAEPDVDTLAPVGVHVVLTDAVSEQPLPRPAAVSRPLEADVAEVLLTRLAGPAVEVEPHGFRFPARSLPAPRPGTSTRGVFLRTDASAPSPPVAPSEPLRVVHTAPHGDVATPSQVSITFSRPMVPLAELGGGRDGGAPPGVRLTPAVPGGWRWLDPRTLVFEAAGRLPKATRYTVDIPANLEAAGGEPLGEAVQWTFATSPPIVLEVVPPDVPGRSPVLALVFDQRVDAEAVLPFLRLEIEGRDFPLRLTPADDSSAAEVLGRAMWRGRVAGQSAPDSAQFVVVRPEDSLPSLGADSDEMIEAVIRTLPGLPSLEGPERTIADAEHRFEIARAFSVVEHGCGRAFTCWPGVPWTIRFNHQLGVRPDSGTWLRVDPPLPGATVEAWNDHLIVLGMPEEGRTYTVWVDPAVASQSGQKLGPISPLRFSIGRTPPSVWAPGGGIAMIPATQPASFPILAEGLDEIDVEVRTVTPQDWAEYESMLKTRVAGIVPWGTPVTEFYRGLAPGESLYRKTMPVKRVRGGPAEVELELDAALDGTGHVLVIAEPVSDGTPAGVPDGLGHIVFSWVQRSEMQLDVQEDGDALTVYVTSVVTGRPLRDVRLTLTRETATSSRTGPREPRDTVVTDEGGLARQLVHHVARGDSWLLRAERDGRTVLFPAMLVRGWPDPREWAPDVRRHFLTDRPIYQPGDTVRFAGWLRTAVGTGREPVLPEPLSYIEYVAHDPRGATLAQGQIFEMSPNGRIEGSFVLPAEANAGRAFIELMLTGLAPEKPRTFVEFQIEEVRRPNFDLSVEVEPGPLLPGEPMTATVRARYFTGGGVPGADVRWLVGSSVSHYSPPGVTGYSFGRVIRTRNVLSPAEHTSRTDAAGDHRLDARIESVQPDVAMELTVEATVVDLDRQERTAHANMLVHPANVYVGLRAAAPFVRAGEPLEIETLVVALDGRAVADRPVTVIAMRQDRHPEAGILVIDESERARCELMSQLEPVRCELSDLPQGDYLVVASVQDNAGRRSSSELGVRIAGETIPAGVRAAAPGVTVEPDREEYEPGDTALVLVKASFPAVEALLTLSRGGVIEAHAVTLENGAALDRLPIRDAHVPNVELAVAAHAADGASARGEASVRIAPRTRALEVHVTPQAAEVAPGAATTIDVTVTDSLGRPIRGADVVLSGIDEAMVALSHRAFTDPLDDIYPWSGSDVFDRTLRDHMAPALTPPGRHPVADAGGTAGTVAGVVLAGSTGAPIGGAWVEAHGVGGTWTGQDGSYQLRGVPAGEHVIVARADGYVARQIPTITVEAGGSARAHFVMLTNWEVLEGGRSLTGDPLAFGGGHSTGLALLAADAAAIEMPAPSEAGRYARYRFGVSTQAGSDDVLRRDLSPVAAFVGRAVTDADGHVAIPVDMPDNLTRYRIRAVTAKGAHLFGAGESTITVRRPLIVRPTPPRFLNQGDRFELPVLLENRSGEALEVDVAVRATNAELDVPAGRRVVVPAEDRLELRFPATAGLAGAARFQVAAEPSGRRSQPAGPADPGVGVLLATASGESQETRRADAATPLAIADAVEIEVPVYVPAVTETFAVYGRLDDATPVGYPVRLPESALPGQARVELGFSTTAAHGLRDAFWFLLRCPYELTEVSASRILALVALRDAPVAAPGSIAELDSAILADVRRLARSQLRDGGWSVWSARFDADPFITVHAAHALARALEAGLAVPERTLADATQWLERLDPAPAPDALDMGLVSPLPAEYPRQAGHTVQAYALDVRRRLGHDVSASAAALLRQAGAYTLTAEALAWLLPTLAAKPSYAAETVELRRELDARVVRSAGTAGIVSPYTAGGHIVFYSPRRTDAVVLDALLEADAAARQGQAAGRPTAAGFGEVIAPLALGLMAHRVRGRWSNTQENAFAVVALARYLAAAEAVEPDLRVRAWTGDRLAGEHAFHGRNDERHEVSIPADSLGGPGEDLDLVLAREGAGRLYYRVGLSYATAGATPPISRGFEIRRVYEAVDDPDDVRRDSDGTWRVRRGARVRVRLSVAAPGPRHHVAVVDPLPAGLEAINPYLAGTTSAFALPDRHEYGPADSATRDAPFHAEHVNVRGDRFEAFTSRLEPGRREIVYYALATTPGDFAAPAPRAEEMYAPETFGRGAAERLVVEPRDATP